MKSYLLLGVMLLWSATAFGRNDQWMSYRYSVSLSFGAPDLGKKNGPIPQKVSPPEFPAEMIRAAFGGEVTLDYTVSPDGRVSEITIVKSSAEEFEKAVSAVVLTWIFAPAFEYQSGKRVSARMRCKVRFSLTEEEEPNQSLQPTAPSGRG